MANKIGFIIPTCIHTNIHLKQLNRCLNSIATFHPHSQIILINDTPDILENNFNDGIQKIIKQFNNILDISIVKSLNAGSGELQTFKVLLETPAFKCETAVIIQDAMVLLEPLTILEAQLIEQYPVQFLWYFTNHILQWDSILEPETEYNRLNNITTHKDLLIDCILTDFRDNLDFQKFAINRLCNMHLWVGCFGCCCIITKSAVKKMQELVPFIDTFTKYTARRYRCCAESIYALICHFVFQNNDFRKSVDGLYYDGINVNSYNGSSDGLENGVKWCARNKYIGKISFGR